MPFPLLSFRTLRLGRIVAALAFTLAAMVGTPSAWAAAASGVAVIAADADAPGDPPILTGKITLPDVPTGPWQRREIAVASLASGEAPPKIDGSLDDPCWRRATRAVGFFRNQGTLPVAEQTEAWLLCDRKHLYVAFHCLDSDKGRIRASETRRDGDIDGDDHVGIDIDSQNRYTGLSTFRVTARGTQAESIEGGTADNITWVGDWHAAVRNVKDGWTCEMAIPFALMRYPKGTTRFGLVLFRRLARESSREVWPYLPPEGDGNEAQYLHAFTGFDPPPLASRPVFLPYVLTTAGQTGGSGRAGSALREGLDIKYPLTTTLTGVATVNPDFQTVEQDVTNISFSYTEKYLPDHRPFFAEGSNFLPAQDQFYSLRVGQIDGGVKVVGKEKDTSIGVLGTTFGGNGTDPATGQPRQQVTITQVRQDLTPMTYLYGSVVDDSEGGGVGSNRTMKAEAGWSALAPERYRPNAIVNYIPSWVNGRETGAKEFFHFGTGAPNGRPNTGINYSIVPDDFNSFLGYNPDLNERGYNAWVEQYNNFDRGAIQNYWTGINFGHERSVRPDTFFSQFVSPEVYLEIRRGWAVDLAYTQSQRQQYRDHTTDYDFSWGRKTLFQRGGGHVTLGQVADAPYKYVTVNQSMQLAKPLTFRVDESVSEDGGSRQTQTILTGSYLLDDTRTLALRVVCQAGHAADPASGDQIPVGNNLYLSYSRHVRAGYDLFVLIGDPNAVTTKGLATVKIIQPF